MIDNLLKAAKNLSVRAPEYKEGFGKGLEALILFSLAAELKHSGCEVAAFSYRGRRIRGRFVLRGGPGNLNLMSDVKGASYFNLKHVLGVVIELHNSLELLGNSREEHEVDICAIWGDEACAARQSGTRKLNGPPLVGIEVKHFGDDTPVNKNISRALFACVIDFVPDWAMRPVTLELDRYKIEIWPSGRSGKQFWILTTGKSSSHSKAFLRAYDINLVDEMDSTRLSGAMDDIAGHLGLLLTLGREKT